MKMRFDSTYYEKQEYKAEPALVFSEDFTKVTHVSPVPFVFSFSNRALLCLLLIWLTTTIRIVPTEMQRSVKDFLPAFICTSY